jgi:hypothetical protein
MWTIIAWGIAIVLSFLGFFDFLHNIPPIYFFAAAILFYLHGILSKLNEKKEESEDHFHELPYERDSEEVDYFDDGVREEVVVDRPKKLKSKKEKLEAKLKDLTDVLKIGLVPKKDLKKHKEKIKKIRARLNA